MLTSDGRLALTMKAGDGTTIDRAGRHFTFWTAEALDAALAAAGFAVTHASTEIDQIRSHTAWLLRVAEVTPSPG